MATNFLDEFLKESERWGWFANSIIYFDRFLYFANLNRFPGLKPIRSLLCRIIFPVQLKRATPVFVFQMGKVGSLSIYQSLLLSYPGAVIHSHTFSEDDSQYHIRELYDWAILKNLPINIISPVREPIPRNISSFFHSFIKDSTISMDQLLEMFLDKYQYATIQWFEFNIKNLFDINVYSEPFLQEGYRIYSKNNIRLLVFRSEMEDASKEQIIRNFLGIRNFKITNTNFGSEKAYAMMYQNFKDQVKFPKYYIDRMCDSQYSRYFYDQQTIEKTRERWSDVMEVEQKIL